MTFFEHVAQKYDCQVFLSTTRLQPLFSRLSAGVWIAEVHKLTTAQADETLVSLLCNSFSPAYEKRIQKRT